MGIRFSCPNGHKLNVKAFLAGKRGVCPHCGVRVRIPLESETTSQQATPNLPQKASTTQASPEEASPAAQVEKTPAPKIVKARVPETDSRPSGVPFEMGFVPANIPPVLDQPAGEVATSKVLPTAPIESVPAKPSESDEPVTNAPQDPAIPLALPVRQARVPEPTRQEAQFKQEQPAAAVASPGVETDTSQDEMQWYVRPQAGGQYGPATRDVVADWVNQNRVGADSLVWQEGWEDWRPAGEVFDQFQTQPVAEVAPAITPIIQTSSSEAPSLRLDASSSTTPTRKNHKAIVWVATLGLLSVVLLVILLVITQG